MAVENDDGSLSIPRTALRDAVFATSGYEGLTGIITCTELGDCATDVTIGIFEGPNWPVDGGEGDGKPSTATRSRWTTSCSTATKERRIPGGRGRGRPGSDPSRGGRGVSDSGAGQPPTDGSAASPRSRGGASSSSCSGRRSRSSWSSGVYKTLTLPEGERYSGDFWIDQIVNGIGQGAILALIALGYTLVYGILRMINFAHGEVFMAGAFISFFFADAYCEERLPELQPYLALVDPVGRVGRGRRRSWRCCSSASRTGRCATRRGSCR